VCSFRSWLDAALTVAVTVSCDISFGFADVVVLHAPVPEARPGLRARMRPVRGTLPPVEAISRTVTGSDDFELHALEWSREGVPLLLLHGFGNEAHIWDDFASVVAPHYRTVGLDHRGHGDSAWDADGRYDLETLVCDVEAATAALDIGRLVVIGHSLGGRVAALFAARNIDRMAGLVIVDIGPDIDVRGAMRIQMDVEANVAPRFASIAEYERMLSIAYPAGQPAAIGRMARHGLRQCDDGSFELKMDPALRGAMSRRDGEELDSSDPMSPEAQWDALARISCPTLVVRGAASDILSADTADKMVDEVLADGRLAVVPLAGHSVMTDNPEGFRDAVTDFVLA
jgi:pimeloyl-ACP methyl ester carboxylesterase